MKNPVRSCILVASLICGSALVAYADEKTGDFTCKGATVKVANPTKLVIVCLNRWPTGVMPVPEIWEYQSRNDPRKGPTDVTGTAAAAVRASEDQLLDINVDTARPLQGGRKYVIAIATATGVGQTGYFDLVTDAKATIVNNAAAALRGSNFTVKTPVTLTSGAGATFYEKKDNVETTKDANIHIPNPDPSRAAEDPDTIGVATVQVKSRLRQGRATIGVKDLTDVFGQTVNAEEPVDLSPPPKGKDDALQYYQFNHLGASGAKPSVVINVKANSLPGVVSSFWIGNFLAQPDIFADTGTNDFARKTDDSIRLGMTTTRTSKSSFGFILYGPGFSYETNYGFKKNNLVGNFEARFIPVGWYRTREMRRFEKAAESGELALDKVRASDFKFGRGIEFFLGMEAGGSVREQEFFNKAKTTSIPVPRYSIVRFRPRLHAFIEYDRVTLDWSGTLRVLGTNELVAEEQPNNRGLNLRRIDGARGIMETVLSFGIDESKHINLAITYKRGSQPPNFKHTHSVLTGFVIKY